MGREMLIEMLCRRFSHSQGELSEREMKRERKGENKRERERDRERTRENRVRGGERKRDKLD